MQSTLWLRGLSGVEGGCAIGGGLRFFRIGARVNVRLRPSVAAASYEFGPFG